MTVKFLDSLRTGAKFTLFWTNVSLKRRDLDVMEMQKQNFMGLWKINIAKFIIKRLTQLLAPYETVSIKMDTKLI